MTYTVTGGIARLNWWYTEPGHTYYDADGTVCRYPFGWSQGDPEPPCVFVTDLNTQSIFDGYIQYFTYAYDFTAIVDYGTWDDSDGIARDVHLTPIPEGGQQGNTQVISLRSPAVITPYYQARWKFRSPFDLQRKLKYHNFTRRRHGFVRELGLGYDYFVTPDQRANGWLNNILTYSQEEPPMLAGWVDDDNWFIRWEGDGQARLMADEFYREGGSSFAMTGGESGQTYDGYYDGGLFTPTPDAWYIMEYEAGEQYDEETESTFEYAKFTLYEADGDDIGAQVASVQYFKDTPLESEPKLEGTGSCTAPNANLTTDYDGWTWQDEYKTIYIDGLPFWITNVTSPNSFDFQSPDYDDSEDLIDGDDIPWEMPAVGPRWLGVEFTGWIWGTEHDDFYAEFDWIQVWNDEDVTVPIAPGTYKLREGWLTERCWVTDGTFTVSNSPARGTYNVYDLAGGLMELGVDYDQTDAAGGRNFVILNGLDYEAVEVTYLGVPPSLRFRPTTPRVRDPNYYNAQQIRQDRDVHGH